MNEATLPIPPPTAPGQRTSPPEPPPRPRSAGASIPTPQAPTAPTTGDPETLREYLQPAAGRFVRSLPRVAPRLAIFLGAIVLINAVLHPLSLWRLPPTIASIATVLIFLSAAYSSILPKTVFWAVGFLWVKAVLRHWRRRGTDATAARFREGIESARALLVDGAATRPQALVGGAGFGLGIGIYLSGGMLGRSTPAILTWVALVFLLGAKESNLVTVLRLGAADVVRLLGRDGRPSEEAVRTTLAAGCAGLVVAVLPMLIGIVTAGYILAGLAILAGLIMPLVRPGPATS